MQKQMDSYISLWSFSLSQKRCWLIGAELENLATLSPTSSPFSGVLTSL